MDIDIFPAIFAVLVVLLIFGIPFILVLRILWNFGSWLGRKK